MISKGRIILSYIMAYILFVMWGVVLQLFMKTVLQHYTWEEFEQQIVGTVVILGIVVLFLLAKELIYWQQLYGKIYPIFKNEGMSPHFFQAAEEYGKTIESVKISTPYWLNLVCYYQTMNQDDMALQAFVKADAAYIHSIKNKKSGGKRTLVKLFFNNGLAVCLKTGNLDDARRLYQDGFPYLQQYMTKDIAVLDTLAEYHFQMKEYEQAAKLYEKLLAKGNLPVAVVKTATDRVAYAKEQSTK